MIVDIQNELSQVVATCVRWSHLDEPRREGRQAIGFHMFVQGLKEKERKPWEKTVNNWFKNKFSRPQVAIKLSKSMGQYGPWASFKISVQRLSAMKSRQVTPQAPGPLWPASIPAGDGLREAFLQRTQKSEFLQGEMEIWGCILWLGQVSSLGFPPESPTPSKIIQQSPNNDPFETKLVELQSFSNLLSCPTIVLLQNPNTLRSYQCFS